MRLGLVLLLLATVLGAAPTNAQPQEPSTVFRRGNEHAAHARWDDAIDEYSHLGNNGVVAPSLFWNWAQVASARGTKGEAVWALLRAQELTPTDASIRREIERIRGELGLDPSEVSLGFFGDLRTLAKTFRLDLVAIAAFSLSLFARMAKKLHPKVSLSALLIGIMASAPLLSGNWREPRGVVVQKDAALFDAARDGALALATLREGEVVPILGEEGNYVRIQDASGARGFAYKTQVMRLGVEKR